MDHFQALAHTLILERIPKDSLDRILDIMQEHVLTRILVRIQQVLPELM